ncbi:MAG: Smr/MutS family protein, partial [Candidatus Adiutrix sp.]|nr:Smr/MutS family protein [Candidatus Adiutrix sp.]
GRGCVLLIHGRGLGSHDGVPVLKRYLETFLLRGTPRKYILAFTTARPLDGGLGASYILLRR